MSRIKELYEILRDIYVEPSNEAREIALNYGYLPYMVQRYIDILGADKAVELLESFTRPPKLVVRTNTTIIAPQDLEKRLKNMGFQLERIPWTKESFWVISTPKSPSLGATHEYLKGLYYVHKDATSLIPTLLLMHEYCGDVLDACAAPGGKATHMAQTLKQCGGGYVYANDLVLYRLKALVGHVMRMKLDNVVVTWGDARRLPEKISRKFDRILLDAPCSGEGRISVDPGRKYRTSLLDLVIMVKREIELLWNAVDMLKPGGLVAYVTCSIAPEENEYVINEIITKKSSIRVVEPPLKLFDYSPGLTVYRSLRFNDDVENCIRVWPFKHGLFGYFVCLLRKQ